MIGDAGAISALMPGLAPEGCPVLLGGGRDPLPVPMGYPAGGERGILGSIAGTPCGNQRAPNLSVPTGVRPMIEALPLDRAMEPAGKCGPAT